MHYAKFVLVATITGRIYTFHSLSQRGFSLLSPQHCAVGECQSQLRQYQWFCLHGQMLIILLSPTNCGVADPCSIVS